jgi:endoglycosylceramidase
VTLETTRIGLILLASAALASAQPATTGLPAPKPEQRAKAPDPWNPLLGGRLRVAPDRRIRDPFGREVLLRGVNAGKKSGDLLPVHTADDVKNLVEKTGINFVRLYVSWRGIEPKPNVYDKAYLDGIAEQVRRWNAYRVYVLIDMHQDLWGGSFAGHGAPEWATLGGPSKMKAPDGPWQLRYADPAVWMSFEALWRNTKVPATGKGLQDHLAGAWQAVARHLGSRPGIVGYDLLNEPFFGQEVATELKGIAKRALRPAVVAAGKATARAGLEGIVSHLKRPLGLNPLNPLGPLTTVRDARRVGKAAKKGFLEGLDQAARDPEVFKKIMAAFEPANVRFAARLSRFYTRVGGALQRVDPKGLMFVEPMALTGVGVKSRMPRPALRNLVYAPHLYDAFVDSGMAWDGQIGRLKQALLNHRLEAERLGAALVLGEWGNAHRGNHGDFLVQATKAVNRAGVGAAYWDHEPGEESSAKLRVALTSYPRRVAGILRTFSNRPGRFVAIYTPSDAVAAPSVMVVPKAAFPTGVRVSTPTGIRAEWRYDAKRQLLLVRCPKDAKRKGVMIVVVTPAKAGDPTSGVTERMVR